LGSTIWSLASVLIGVRV